MLLYSLSLTIHIIKASSPGHVTALFVAWNPLWAHSHTSPTWRKLEVLGLCHEGGMTITHWDDAQCQHCREGFDRCMRSVQTYLSSCNYARIVQAQAALQMACPSSKSHRPNWESSGVASLDMQRKRTLCDCSHTKHLHCSEIWLHTVAGSGGRGWEVGLESK